MDTVEILGYGGIAILIVLLVVYELKDILGNGSVMNGGYEYYTADGSCVRILHLFSAYYKVYALDFCPVQMKRDRLGNYFILRARSAIEVEHKIDELYQMGGAT